jgi:iron complex outermembrane receptor protein
MQHPRPRCARRIVYRPLIALAAVVMAMPPECAGAQVGGERAVEGIVVAGATGSAVAGARVTAAGTALETRTDAAGRFRLSSLDTELVDIEVSAPGFLELRIDEIATASATPIRIELDLTPDFMERVQVTATKAPLRVGDLAAQTDIVDREQVDQRNDQSLTKAIEHVPGLVVSTQAGSFESVTLRGLPRDGNEFTTTLLLIDGIPQVDSRNSARVVNLPINDASTIEVLRGPSSALYGRTAIGGAVHLRTADPTPDHQFSLDLTGGEFDTLRGLARISGPIAPWGGYYLSASAEENQGYFNGPIDFEVERTALLGKFSFVPDSKSFGWLSLNTVDSDQSTPTNVPIIDGRLLTDIDPRFDRLSNLNLPGPNYHQEEDRLTGRYTRQLSPQADLVALVGYREIQYKFIDDGDVTGAPYDLANNTLTMYPFDLQTDEEILYSELRFEIDPTPDTLPSSLVVGASFEDNSGFSAGNLIYTDPDTFGWPLDYLTAAHPPRDQWQFFRFGGNDYSLESTGVFAQYIVEPSPRWVLTAGARYDRLDLDNTLTFSEGQPRAEDSFDEISPKLSATYKVVEAGSRPGVSVYASYSEAFLPPRRPSQLRPSDTPVELEPEDIENWELGIKGGAADGNLSYDATYFRADRTGIVTSVRQGPFFLPTNAGEHEYEGFEGALRWSSSPRLAAYLNIALYDNRFGDFVIESSGGDTVLTGNRLPIAPDEVYNAGLVVRPADDVDVTLDVRHIGSVMVDQGNTFELDSYTLVDLALSWRLDPVRLILSGHNLFDEEYFSNGDISNGESADPGRPRQVLLTASFQWPG